MQRLRAKYYRGEEIKYISHLDLMRLWQRAFVRAGIAIAYSEGYNPHPRISLAAPLALGITSEAELMDAVIADRVSPHYFMAAVNQVLPAGAGIAQVHEIPVEVPSLQSQMRFAEYRVGVKKEINQDELDSAIKKLLAMEALPWQHMRDTGPHRYDLRRLVEDVWCEGCDEGRCTLGMKLRCDGSGTGRPEQVTLALGLKEHPYRIHRTRLVLAG
jgi:radical SAM-linked protein